MASSTGIRIVRKNSSSVGGIEVFAPVLPSEFEMTPEELVLVMLAMTECNSMQSFQLQKLAFIISDRLKKEFQLPPLQFRAGDYGPTSEILSKTVDGLIKKKLVFKVTSSPASRGYLLTAEGTAAANVLFGKLNGETTRKMKVFLDWGMPLTFSELIPAVYKAYPEMAVNAVFSKP